MKKFLLSIFTFLFIPGIINAASANVQVSAPSSVYVGDTVKVSVTVSSGSSLGNWNYIISYDDSILEYVTTDADTAQSVFGEASNGGQTSATNTWTFRAKSSGSASFNVSSISVISWDDFSEMSIGGSTSTSISVVKPSSGGSNGGSSGGGYSNYNYSDDNNLSSLNIEGFDINFDSSVTEYNITVPNDTKKVKVGASANDGNASVEGIGDYDVKEGNNEINIVVTAENGDTKVYKINVVVKELDPIEVKVGDKTYTVIRKEKKLPKANSTYKVSTILIKGETVPCYHSEIADIYLIGLVDEDGKSALYNYDSKNDKFSVYNEINIGGLYISLIDTNEVPVGYKTGMVKIGEKEYNGFIKDGAYSLLYGINLETGEKNYYSYDASESTIQKFATSVSKGMNLADSKVVLYSLIGLCVFEFIMIIVSVVSKNKALKKVLGNKLNTKTEYEKALESVEEGTTEEIEEATAGSEELFTEVGREDFDSTADYKDAISDSTEELEEVSEEPTEDSFNTEEIEEGLGRTALISKSVTNVYNNTKNRKESIKERKALRKKKKKENDDMFKF